MFTFAFRPGRLPLLTGLALLALTPLAGAAHPAFRGLPPAPHPAPFVGHPANFQARFPAPFTVPPATRILSTPVVANPFFRQFPSGAALARQAMIDPLTRFNQNAALTQTALLASQGFPIGSGFGSPLTTALLAQGANLTALNSVWNNPFAYGGLPYYAGYAGLYGGYGGYGYGSYGGYGGGGYGADPLQATADHLTQVKAAEQARQAPTLFTAYGLPSQDGRLQWPLGLRVMRGAGGADQLRDQVDLLAEAALNQKATHGTADSRLVRQMDQAIAGLRQQLVARSTDLPLTTYEEARRFLRQLQDTVEGLR